MSVPKQSINIWVIAAINLNYIKCLGSHHMFVNIIVFYTSYICLNVCNSIEIFSVFIAYGANSNVKEGRFNLRQNFLYIDI